MEQEAGHLGLVRLTGQEHALIIIKDLGSAGVEK